MPSNLIFMQCDYSVTGNSTLLNVSSLSAALLLRCTRKRAMFSSSHNNRELSWFSGIAYVSPCRCSYTFRPHRRKVLGFAFLHLRYALRHATVGWTKHTQFWRKYTVRRERYLHTSSKLGSVELRCTDHASSLLTIGQLSLNESCL